MLFSFTESMPDGIDSVEGSERRTDQPQEHPAGEDP